MIVSKTLILTVGLVCLTLFAVESPTLKTARVVDSAGRAFVRVEPEESSELFANPYMGWQTFHHFADDDATLRDLPSGCAYFRFYWHELETADGQIDRAQIDALLASAHRAHQKLALRIMCTGSEKYMDVPARLKAQGCAGYEFRYEEDRIGFRKLLLALLAISIVCLLVWIGVKFRRDNDSTGRWRILKRYALAHLALAVFAYLIWNYAGARHWVPDFADPVFRKEHTRFIQELGKKLDGHPDFDTIDIGSVGLWGEWHMFHTPRTDTGENVDMPAAAVLNEIVDLYQAAFPTTPKALLLNDPPTVAHAISKGSGWRADSFGDMGGDSKAWSHMVTFYPKWIAEAHAEEAWKTGPIEFENAWDMRRWAAEGWNIHDIFDQGLQWHISYLNNKSAPLPDQTVGDVRQFLLKIGYRLALISAKYPEQVSPGTDLSIAMDWKNAGVAPPYRDALIAVRLKPSKSGEKEIVLTSGVSVKGWLPGSISAIATFNIPKTLPAGTYFLELALVDTQRHEPLMQLANKGTTHGWFRIGEINLQ